MSRSQTTSFALRGQPQMQHATMVGTEPFTLFHYSAPSITLSVDIHRGNTRRTLGRPQLDQQRPLRRIRKNARRARNPIRPFSILPPNVPLEQRHVLQTSRPQRHPLLLARRAQSPLLLRHRLRCFPLDARPQQDLRLHYQSL